MRFTSFRTRVAVLSTLFGLVFVGAVAILIYFVVAQSMRNVAQENTARIARITSDRIKEETALAMLRTSTLRMPREQQLAEASRQVQRELLQILNRRDVSNGEFAVYDENMSYVWLTSDQADLSGTHSASRSEAVRRMQPIAVKPTTATIVSGLFSKANLGTYVIHVPFLMPDRKVWVADVVYFPRGEESTIDRIRPPMVWVAAGAILIAISLMQVSMGWVLRLVNQLQKAADSIDAGRLDHRLPDFGRNEVGDLAQSLNWLIDRLRHRSEIQTRFVADASHELATPVAGIRGYVNILRTWGGEDEEVREEALAAIDRESRRMARLCGDLLSVIRSGSTELEYRSVRYDVNAVIRDTLANAATRYMSKGLEFVGPSGGPLELVGDPERIEEALAILVDNACKYTPSNGRVRVSSRIKRDFAVIEVSDTGPGIPEEDIDNIFERFYRSDRSRSQAGGFGLGLSIAQKIVMTSGGTIDVTSTGESGTTFTVRLPRRNPRDQRQSAEDARRDERGPFAEDARNDPRQELA